METLVNVVVVPEADWQKLLQGQAELLRLVQELKGTIPVTAAIVPFITAMEFMQAVRIGRTKFDQLVAANKVKTIKKDRKIYVPVGEIERYFNIGNP
ncbi:MAG: hypothetical protein IPP99_00545 [Chitinophagaceae bacterium]|jgi:hypothetical protein|nr:hypothetical protein [Chitinophagaceae bacterium]MBL0335374.1 hypothetical protein [Chitinophagaceae bacterium]MBN8669004.1 hypothetical protein [Chitinophagales bacterium]